MVSGVYNEIFYFVTYQSGFPWLSPSLNLVTCHSFMPLINIFRGSSGLCTDKDSDLTKLKFNREHSYEADIVQITTQLQ